MKLIKLYVFIGLFLIIGFFSLNCVAAEENDLKIKLDVYEPVNSEDKLDYTKDILLSLEIINNNNYWVSIGNNYNSRPQLTLEIKNKDETKTYNDFFAGTILIPPSDTTTIIFPFVDYNDMEIDERIDSWSIKPQLEINDINYYNNPFEATEVDFNYPFSSSTSPIVGNMLIFDVEDPNAKLNVENNDENNILNTVNDYRLKENMNISDNIFVGLVITIICGIGGFLWYKFKP